MPIPPSFADLGKAARDLFSKGYNYGQYKIETKTKSSTGVEFTTNGASNHESGKYTGSIETKYKMSEYGLTLLEKWNTDNHLGTEVTIEDQICTGLKLAFDTQFVPNTGKKSGKIKTEYRRDCLHTNLDVDFDFAGPTIMGAAVIGHSGWLLGCQVAFDTSKSKLSQSNIAVGYSNDDFTMLTAINDGNDFHGSIFHKVDAKLEMGTTLNWAWGGNDTRFGIAAKYMPDPETTLRAKMNNATQLGLSYQQKIRQGLTLTLSTLVEGKTFNQGGHKFGIGLEFEA